MNKHCRVFRSSNQSLQFKVFASFLVVNGVLVQGKRSHQILAAGFFNAVWAVGTLHNVLCIFIQRKKQPEFQWGIILQNLQTLFLWWTLYLRRKEIFNFVANLLNDASTKKKSFSKIKMLSMVLLFIFLFPPIVTDIAMFIRAFVEGAFNGNGCRRLWIPQYYLHGRLVFFLCNVVIMHISFGIFYVPLLGFCACSLKILGKLKSIAPHNGQLNPLAWKNFKICMTEVANMENIFSLPVFWLLARIATTTFSTITLPVSDIMTKFGILIVITTAQMIIWFLLVAVAGDTVQKRCLDILNGNYEPQVSDPSLCSMTYLDYKKLKVRSQLTAWNFFKIDRVLLLTAFTSVITYGVIVSELKG